MQRINFYVGIIPESKNELIDFVKQINAEIKSCYDDTHGYLTYTIRGTWDDYRTLANQKFTKSISHYEDD